MSTSRRTLAVAGVLALVGAAAAFAPQGHAAPGPDAAPEAAADAADASHHWHIKASGARIIGGYGDNFAYDGENVRPIEGSAEARIDPTTGKGEVTVKIRTTGESGPIHFARDTKWEGEIEIVQKLDTEKMGKARIAQDIFLHGDTGNEAPVMPRIYNYFATWGPSKIMVNGEEAVPMIGSHTMFSEQSRGSDGKIRKGDTVYHPAKVKDKTGFTDADELEFHFVAHTSETDRNNFPPHSAWIHLHFSEVEVVSKPPEAEIPYTRQQASAN